MDAGWRRATDAAALRSTPGSGQPVAGDAQHRARLAYAAYVGFLQLSLQLGQPRMRHEEFDEYLAHVMSTLIPG